MPKTLDDRIWQALKDRGTWEERQRVWYALSTDGIRRQNKPFKGAADLNLPICRNAVNKLKPYYLNGIFGRQQLASFTPLREQQGEASAAAAECLDWKLRKESNYPREMGFVAFGALVYGRFVLKVRWDPREARLRFEAIDPLYFICPGDDCIDEMDWFVHVQVTTVDKYRADPRYTQDEELIDRIRGGEKQEQFTRDQDKRHREGLTWSKDDNQIILWEVWEKVSNPHPGPLPSDGRGSAGWRISTYSPCAKETPVRAPFLCPYQWRGKAYQPFVSFVTEITDKGWYAPRGVVETVAPFHTYATKVQNAKADWFEYSNKPYFTQDVNAGAGTNKENVRLAPGEVLPPGMAPAVMPQPPFELENEINFARQLAEESAGSPDFGIQQQEGGEGGKKARTATEWNYLGSFAGQGIQHASWVWSLSEGEVYWRAWALLLQYGGEELTWHAAESRRVLPEQAKHDQYLIEPDSQPDAWDKTKRFQRAAARKQMFSGNPNIDQLELDRSVLEADDPRLVKKLLIGQSVAMGEEMEDEGKEILLLVAGFPCVVKPGENHALRIKVLAGYMQAQAMQGIAPTPVARQRIQEHLATHVKMLQAQNPQAARPFVQAIEAVDPGMTLGTGNAAPTGPIVAGSAGRGVAGSGPAAYEEAEVMA